MGTNFRWLAVPIVLLTCSPAWSALITDAPYVGVDAGSVDPFSGKNYDLASTEQSCGSAAVCEHGLNLDFDWGDFDFVSIGFSGPIESNQEIGHVDQGTTTVPEPGTISLLGGGLFGLAMLRRRYERKDLHRPGDRAEGI